MDRPAKPRILVVTSTALTEAQLRELQRDVPGAEFVPATEEEVAAKLPGCAGLIGCPRRRFDEAALAAARDSLRWVHVGGAGVEEFLFPAFVESDVQLTNGRALQGPEVADHALALLLAMTRNLHLALAGVPAKAMPRPVELRGKTLLVVGLGGIGLLVAERAAAFGMRVVGVSADQPPLLAGVHRVVGPDQLPEVLPEAQAVVVCAPLTPATRGMFDAAAFARLPRGAYFVNVARGGLVRTDDLVRALEEGHLAGAGLDVTDPEPLPEGHPLRKLPNVVLTPHLAGLSDHNRQRSFELTKANARRFAAGLPLINVVNKRAGF